MNDYYIIILVVSMVGLIASIVTLYLTFSWKLEIEKRCRDIDKVSHDMDNAIDEHMDHIIEQNDDIYELKKAFADIGIETLKVRIADHDRAIESIRKDLLDLQVLSGTLPSRSGTMLQEVENALEELRSVQKNYLEIRAIVDNIKETVANLAEAYSSLHFTGKEIEEMRDELEDLSRRTS